MLRETLVAACAVAACSGAPPQRRTREHVLLKAAPVDAGAVSAFYCSRHMSVGHDIGLCERTLENCESERTPAADMGACVGQSVAACFTVTNIMYGERVENCAPTMAACQRRRVYLVDRMSADFKDASECAPTE
jgi:hypothetical protein